MTLIFLILSFILHETIASCDSVMSFKEPMFVFQSPNYPQSLGNESFTCTLNIQHTPDSNSYSDDVCNDENPDGQNGDGDDDGGGQNGPNVPAICQVNSTCKLEFRDFEFCISRELPK